MKKRRVLKLELVRLEEDTIHLLIQAAIPGLENHWWVIDTGASKSVVDCNNAILHVVDQSAGSMATGLGKEMVETTTGQLSELVLDGIKFDPLMVAIVDLNHINDEYSKYSDKKIVGLLGSDFFYREKALIDYEKCCIYL